MCFFIINPGLLQEAPCIKNPKFVVMWLNPGLSIKKVIDSSGKELDFMQDGFFVKINLDNDYPENSIFNLRIDYTGELYGNSGYIRPEGSYVFSSSIWYPLIVGNSKYKQPGSRGRITIKTTPSNRGIANGKLIYEKMKKTS
jgi:hypothetical protein